MLLTINVDGMDVFVLDLDVVSLMARLGFEGRGQVVTVHAEAEGRRITEQIIVMDDEEE